MNIQSIERQGGVRVIPPRFGENLRINAAGDLSHSNAQSHLEKTTDRVARDALSTLGAMVEPFRLACDAVTFIMHLIGANSLQGVGKLLTPTGFKGMICSITGQCLGSFYMLSNAGTISANIMTSIMDTGCRLYGESYIASTIAQFGGRYIAEHMLTPVVFFVGGVAGGYALVLVGNAAGNVVYKLCFDDPEQKRVADQLRTAVGEG